MNTEENIAPVRDADRGKREFFILQSRETGTMERQIVLLLKERCILFLSVRQEIIPHAVSVRGREIIMEKLMQAGGLIFLAATASEDIRKREISGKGLALGLMAALCLKAVAGNFWCEGTLLCVIPGILLLWLSAATGESIGYGDGMAVCVLGLWIGGGMVLKVLAVSFLLAGIGGIICVFRKKREPMPFIPFLLLGLEVAFLL